MNLLKNNMKWISKFPHMFQSIPRRATARLNTAAQPWSRIVPSACLLALLVLTGLAPRLRAQEQVIVPELVNYQGRLQSVLANKSYTNGLYDIEFRIWNAAVGTNKLLWAESYSVYVKDGYFNVILGQGGNIVRMPSTPQYNKLRDVFRIAAGTTDRYLGITVKQDENHVAITDNLVECTPRQQLLSTPFAFQAQYAQYAINSGSNMFTANNGLLVIGSPLRADVEAIFNKGLTVSGAKAVLQNDLQVAGKATFSGSASVAGGLDLAGQTVLRGNIDIKATTTGGGFVPIGAILMWSGTDVPEGWALCNGKTNNNIVTPDLRGRFVLGANTDPVAETRPEHKIKASGGAETQTLNIEQMPKHTHDLSVKVFGYSAARNGDNELTAAPKTKFGVSTSQTYTPDESGSGQAFSLMPPYYVLAYIIRVK